METRAPPGRDGDGAMTPRRPPLHALLTLAACAGLGGLFLLAAAPKLADPHAFAAAVYRYQWLPDAAVNLFALGHAWLELVLAVAILFPRWRRAAAAWMILLLAAGAVAIGVNLARGLDMACGCFSLDPLAPPATWFSVVRNLALALPAAYLARRRVPATAGDRP